MKAGDFLKKRRKELNMSQKELSEAACVPQTTISDYERGATNPSANNLTRLVKVLDISLDDLLGQNAETLHQDKDN